MCLSARLKRSVRSCPKGGGGHMKLILTLTVHEDEALTGVLPLASDDWVTAALHCT